MKKILIIIAILIFVLISTYYLSPNYLKTAIVYQQPNIDDYKIFENRVIKADKHIEWKLAKNYNKKELTHDKLSKLEDLETVAFLIIQDEEILFEKYWQEYNINSLSNSFSVSKSIVSLLIGIAIDEEKIKNVEQKVGDFIPEFSKGKNENLSIKHLLTMSSGLNWDEAYSSPFSITTKAYYGNDIKSLVTNLKVVEELGENWKYLSGNTQLLALILEKATGKKLADYASEKLWKPLGAKNDALWSLDKKDGTEKAYCCFNSNARDFARIGQLILNKGMYDDVQVVSKKYIDEATKAANYLNDETGKIVDFYGYQFWIIDYLNYKIPYARGILGQYIFVIPGKNAVVVRLGHKRSENRTKDKHVPDDIYLILDAAMEMLD